MADAAKVSMAPPIVTMRFPSTLRSSALKSSDRASDKASVKANTSHLSSELIPLKQDISTSSLSTYIYIIWLTEDLCSSGKASRFTRFFALKFAKNLCYNETKKTRRDNFSK